MSQAASRALARWMLAAVLIRFIAALTYATWHHPDEWYQTVELANLLVNHVAMRTQEITLHLRNLSWPALLALPLWLARWLCPASVKLRVFLFQFFTGILDLGILWGFWRASEKVPGAGPRLRNVFMALLVLPWFMAHDSVRPSSEHVSTVALWLALGSLAVERRIAAGILTVGIGALRYPSGLFSVGLLAGLWKRAGFRRFALGLAAGFLIWGALDWIIYGRPWESLWMYLQFNVFTSAGVTLFGKQSMAEYWQFIARRWFHSLLPLGIALAVTGAWGLWLALRSAEPWAFALVAYLLGHLLISHKEGRFMLPLESLWLFASLNGLARVNWGAVSARWSSLSLLARRSVQGVVVAWLAVQAAFLWRALWGDTWVAAGTYLEVSRQLLENPQACAVVTVRRTPSVLLPQAPLALLSRDPDRLAWFEKPPRCAPGQTVLLQLQKPDAEWESAGCELLPSGFFSILPRKYWEEALEKRLESGPWYRCPPQALEHVPKRTVEHPLAFRFERFPALPAIGTPGEALLDSVKRAEPPPGQCETLCRL